MNQPNIQNYAQRFNRVFDFIDRHLDEPLSTETLCSVAHFSKFHFHRQFANYVGQELNSVGDCVPFVSKLVANQW